MRVDTAAAGATPLLALLSLPIGKASGLDEDSSLIAAWYVLLVMAAAAALLRTRAWAKKSYAMEVFRESFSIANYLRDLALWCVLYAALTAALWFYLPG
jgi:hypothetical protein